MEIVIEKRRGETPKRSAGSKGLKKRVTQIHIQRRRFSKMYCCG